MANVTLTLWLSRTEFLRFRGLKDGEERARFAQQVGGHPPDRLFKGNASAALRVRRAPGLILSRFQETASA